MLCITIFLLYMMLLRTVDGKSIDLLDQSMEPWQPNYCNNTVLLADAGLIQSTLGQFLGYECSAEFYHCRWQSDGFRTYRKTCRVGLVYDTLGTQNCNYDYNVKGCKMTKGGVCNSTEFSCPLSESCIPMSSRCDGRYDCAMEEDEHNCPMCASGEFACVISEQCVPLERRCNGIAECTDGSDEFNCDVCGPGRFLCGKSGECIDGEKRCDGERNCPHGEDEMMCRARPAEKRFTCESRDTYIAMTQVCDGTPDCPDGTDELYCENKQAVTGPQPSPISFPISLSSFFTTHSPSITKDEDPEEEEEEEEEDSVERSGPLFPVLSISFPTTTTKKPFSSRAHQTTPQPTLISSVSSSSTTKVAQPSFPPTKSTSTVASPVHTTRTIKTTKPTQGTVSTTRDTVPTISTVPSTGGTVTTRIQQSTFRATTAPTTVEMLVTATSAPLIIYEKTVTIPTRATGKPIDEDRKRARLALSSRIDQSRERTSTKISSTSKLTIPPLVTTLKAKSTTQPPTVMLRVTSRSDSAGVPTMTTRGNKATTNGRHYKTAVDSSEEEVVERKVKEGGPRNQVVRSLPDQRKKNDEVRKLEEKRISNPRVLALRFNDNDDEPYITTPIPRATKSIIDADLLKKIGAKLDLQSGKSISSRSLLTKIEEVLREELPSRVNEIKKDGRSVRSFSVNATLAAEEEKKKPLNEVKDGSSTTKRAQLRVFPDIPMTIKPQFTFKIMSERPHTTPSPQIQNGIPPN